MTEQQPTTEPISVRIAKARCPTAKEAAVSGVGWCYCEGRPHGIRPGWGEMPDYLTPTASFALLAEMVEAQLGEVGLAYSKLAPHWLVILPRPRYEIEHYSAPTLAEAIGLAYLAWKGQ